MLAPISSVVPYWMMLYGGYKVGRYLQPDDSQLSVIRAGAVSGVFGSVVWVPMQAVKCVAQDSRVSSGKALKMVYLQHGVRGFYRGYLPTVTLFAVPGTMAFFATYENTKELLHA